MTAVRSPTKSTMDWISLSKQVRQGMRTCKVQPRSPASRRPLYRPIYSDYHRFLRRHQSVRTARTSTSTVTPRGRRRAHHHAVSLKDPPSLQRPRYSTRCHISVHDGQQSAVPGTSDASSTHVCVRIRVSSPHTPAQVTALTGVLYTVTSQGLRRI